MEIKINAGLAPQIIAEGKKRGFSRDHVAYCLATSDWETNHTHEPVREAYYLGKKAEAYRKKLRYYPWYGRGLVQLTWEENYKKATEALKVDFLTDPDKALLPEHAVPILLIGMEEGWFTGVKLSKYLDGKDETDKEDFLEWYNSRKIVNGMDKANDIAVLAEQYDKALELQGYGEVNDEAPSDKIDWLSLIWKIIRAVFFGRAS